MPHKRVRHYDVHWHQGQKNGRASMVYALTLDELLASFEQCITRPLHFNNQQSSSVLASHGWKWETWSTHAPMRRILRYCPAINATSVSGTIRDSICGLRPQTTPIPTVASINRYTHRCRYTPRSCFRPEPQDWAHNVSSAVVKP